MDHHNHMSMTTANQQVSASDTTTQHVHDNGMGMGNNGGASGGMNHMMMMVKKRINKHAYARNNNKKQIFNSFYV